MRASPLRPGTLARSADFTSPLTVPGGEVAGTEIVRDHGRRFTSLSDRIVGASVFRVDLRHRTEIETFDRRPHIRNQLAVMPHDDRLRGEA